MIKKKGKVFIMKKYSIYLLSLLIATITMLTGCSNNTNMYDKNDTYEERFEYVEALMHETVSNDFITESETTVSSTVVEPETTTTVVEPETTTTVVEPETTDTFTVSTNRNNILRIAKLKATCETDISACYVNVNSDHNPYDLVWDYGEEYQAYVDACDWSLVWDYDYYINTFPMLAELYNYDKALLLEHFQTVGIHEGRQGSAAFNCEAFRMNSNCPDYERYWAAYFFDYMLNYDTYTNVNTVYENNGNPVYVQYDVLYTAAQLRELSSVNNYRNEVGVQAIYSNAELTCFANYRCYINLTENYYAHDWFEMNDFENAKTYARIIAANAQAISENGIEGKLVGFPTSYIYADAYRASKPHYEAMINSEYNNIGISHVYHMGENYERACQFDTFITCYD